MALAFNRLTFEGILELVDNPCPSCEISKMSTNELQVLNERIDELAAKNTEDQKLYAKLMRLKSFIMLETK